MVYITQEQLKSLTQLLIIVRELNEILDDWISVGIQTERTFEVERKITDMIFELLDLDSESISPLAQSVYECTTGDISVEELLERIRLPALE